jgi:hypothetical protein
MPVDIKVALVADRTLPFRDSAFPAWDTPWQERPSIDLEVKENERLGEVIRRALEAFEVPLPDWTTSYANAVDIAFHDQRYPRGFGKAVYGLTLVDERGRAVWSIWDFEFVPYDQIVRSEEAGILPGEARHLYVIPKSGAGNGVGVGWAELLDAFRVAREVIGIVADVGGSVLALEMLRRVLGRLGFGVEAIDRLVHRWIQRGASFPHTLASSLEGRAWSSERLATLLDCTKEEAEQVLGVLGYAEDESDGLWRLNGDGAAHLLHALLEEIFWYHGDSSTADVRFRERVEELAKTGTLAPRPEFEPDFDLSSFEELERKERLKKAARNTALAGLSFAAGLLSRRRGR